VVDAVVIDRRGQECQHDRQNGEYRADNNRPAPPAIQQQRGIQLGW
jgi:hypothetical protein